MTLTANMSLTLKTVGNAIPVTLQGDAGSVQYQLREMSAADRDTYMDFLDSRMRRDEQGKVIGLARFEGTQAHLVHLCLVDVSTAQRVPKEIIQSWPATTVAALFKEAQKLNMLVDSPQPTTEGKV